MFANKQDLPNAMTASELTDKLGLQNLRNRRVNRSFPVFLKLTRFFPPVVHSGHLRCAGPRSLRGPRLALERAQQILGEDFQAQNQLFSLSGPRTMLTLVAPTASTAAQSFSRFLNIC